MWQYGCGFDGYIDYTKKSLQRGKQKFRAVGLNIYYNTMLFVNYLASFPVVSRALNTLSIVVLKDFNIFLA